MPEKPRMNRDDIFKVLKAWDESLDQKNPPAVDLNEEEKKFLEIWTEAVNDFKSEHLSNPEKKISPPTGPHSVPGNISRKRRRGMAPKLAVAAVLAIGCGVLAVFTIRKASEETIAKSNSAISSMPAAGTLVTKGQQYFQGSERRMTISKGYLEVLSSKTGAVPEVKLFGTDVQADFDLKRPVRFTVENQHIRVSVIGTSFSIDWNSNQGFVTMKSGKLSVQHLRTGEKLILSGRDKIFYSVTGIRKIAALIAPAGERIIITTQSGEVHKGTVIQETEHDIVLRTKDGAQKIQRTRIVDRINEKAILE